jgi:predicted flavoprotein YhiN
MVLRLEILYPMSVKRVTVIGAGAAGLLAAGRAAELGADVTLLEKMERPGRKLHISGNTRCNLSNSRSIEDFIPMYGENGKFLYSAFHHFFRDELVNLLEKYGVRISAEADGRIFPASGKAADIAQAFMRYGAEKGVRLITGSRVTGIETINGQVKEVQAISANYPADAVILATGGASYPQTGSTGDGYSIVERLGHTIIKPRPALSPLVLAEEEVVKDLQGLSLQNIKLTALACPSPEIDIKLIPGQDAGRGLPGRKPRPPVIESRTGDIVFTHYGISGPAALLMSLAITDALANGPASLSIDLLPSIPREQLEHSLQEQFDKHGSRLVHNILDTFIITKIATVIHKISDIPPDKKAGRINTEERSALANLIKSFRFNVQGTRPLAEAMVTAGGVSLAEIDPRSMESKLIKGLFLCGEVIDIDADTGGYNLQAAFSTGYLAGESAAGSG